MEKKMETTYNGLYREYYKDPFLHSWLTKGKQGSEAYDFLGIASLKDVVT